MLNLRTHQQAGFGLVELMIGLAVGMIVVAAAMSLLTTTMSSSNDTIKMGRLDQEMRQVMTMLSRDLRRATIWDPAAEVTRIRLTDPLTLSGTTGNVTVTSSAGNLGDIGAKAEGGTLVYKNGTTVYRGSITNYNSGSYSVTLTGTWPANVTNADGVPATSWNILRPESTLTDSTSCILFASDTDASGTYANGERLGYRLDATDDAVEVRTSANSGDTCTSGGDWENLTDENIVEITEFIVTDNSPAPLTSSGFSIDVREFTIKIKGRLKADPGIERTLQETIRVRNDRLS